MAGSFHLFFITTRKKSISSPTNSVEIELKSNDQQQGHSSNLRIGRGLFTGVVNNIQFAFIGNAISKSKAKNTQQFLQQTVVYWCAWEKKSRGTAVSG